MFESILVGSGELFVAPVGEAYPAVSAAPAGNWVTLGEIDGGVTVNHDQTIDEHGIDSESGSVKATRSKESLTIVANLADATLEKLAKVLDDQTVTPAAGPPAIKTMGMYRGLNVQEYALLFRGNSPYGAFPAQYEVERGYFGGNVGRPFTKENKTLTPVEFHALVDSSQADTEKFGRIIGQTA